jgi:putative heme transporter
MSAAPGPADPATAAPAGGEFRVVRFELSLKSMVIVLGLLAGIWLLAHLLPVLLVLVAALMLVGALNPAVAWLERRKVWRGPAIFLVFAASAALAFTLFTLTVPTLITQVKSLAGHEPQIRETIASFLERSHLTTAMAGDIRQARYPELLKSSESFLLTLGGRAFEIMAGGAAAVFLAFYMMLDRDRLRGALFAVVPRSHHIRLSRILLNLGTIVGGYIRGQVLTCVLMGGFILVLLLSCGVPNALAIAMFGGVMDLLPYIGIFLTMGPAVLAAAGQGPAVAGIVFALLLAYEELESRVLVPLVYGRALRLPSSVVLFSLIVGTTLAGLVGALLALPLAAAVLMLVEELRIELPGEAIQPEDLAQQRADNRGEQEYERRAESMPADRAAAIAVGISGERKKAEEVEAAHAGAAAGMKDAPAPSE